MNSDHKNQSYFSSVRELLQETTFVCFDKGIGTEMDGGYFGMALKDSFLLPLC